MTEALFQFIWQHALFNGTNLTTTENERVTIVTQGKLNTDSGPDFLEARIKIGDTTLVGNIELHIKASDWLLHRHQHDAAYRNIILHVVLENDIPKVVNAPVLVLKEQINPNIERHYLTLMQNSAALPCAGQFESVKEITKENWLARLLAERWEQKLQDWNVLLENSFEDWKNLLYWRMAANFGFKTNAVPFLLLAKSLPLNILSRHRDNLLQVEALLFGQAGMLNDNFDETYAERLQQEYIYLRKKYQLTPIDTHLWKFLRMRPANFPTVRIAQFAALIYTSEHLFSKILETHHFYEIEPLLQVVASEYWDSHFKFGEAHSQPAPKSLGKDSIENIIINTIAPIQFLFATRQGTSVLREQSIDLLESVPAEKNKITTMWAGFGWKPVNASQSQALIQLYNNYCTQHQCLKCAIGLSILKKLHTQ